MEKIYYKSKLIGIKMSSFPKKGGSIPHTEANEPLGLLTLKHPKGALLKPHVHLGKKRVTTILQECFVVLKGKVRIDLYGPDKKQFKHIILNPGQLFIALSGGHGFKILEDCEMLELKNGPYLDDKDFIEI